MKKSRWQRRFLPVFPWLVLLPYPRIKSYSWHSGYNSATCRKACLFWEFNHRRKDMDNVTLIRVVSGILAVVVLVILVYRMKKKAPR